MPATDWLFAVTARPLLSPLGIRLAAAFFAVAAAAVALLAALTFTSTRREVLNLVDEVHRADSRATAVAAAHAYETAGGWEGTDLMSAVAVAARGQAELTVTDSSGRVLPTVADEAGEMLVRMHGLAIIGTPRGEAVSDSVVTNGRVVGTVELRFPVSHLPTPERQIRDALSRNAIEGALLAIVGAITIAVFVARRVSRPITALTAAAAEMESGNRAVRVNLAAAPGELGTLAVAFDRMAEAVALEDKLRHQLVADVAHEVRTPITILRGITEALVDGVKEPDEATLRSLHEEVLRLAQLVGDLETLAAADAAGLQLHRRPFDLGATAAAVVELARPTAKLAELTITGAFEPAPVVADEARLRQIVTTLLANALAYTPADGNISVRTGAAGNDVYVEVADTGPGIDVEDLPHVFQRFYRGLATAGTAGSGIGLAVAYDLVTAHGGTITAANCDTGGAVFTVKLPMR